MKRIKIILLIVIGAFIFPSCKTIEEKEYTKAYWENETRMLELDYLKKLNEVENYAVHQKTMIQIDSIRAEFNLKYK